jgi:hypothetical protein
LPQGLKPAFLLLRDGTSEAVPFQGNRIGLAAEAPSKPGYETALMGKMKPRLRPGFHFWGGSKQHLD